MLNNETEYTCADGAGTARILTDEEFEQTFGTRFSNKYKRSELKDDFDYEKLGEDITKLMDSGIEGLLNLDSNDSDSIRTVRQYLLHKGAKIFNHPLMRVAKGAFLSNNDLMYSVGHAFGKILKDNGINF